MQSMRGFKLLLLMAVTAAMAATAVAHSPEEAAFGIIVSSVVISIIFGWVVTLENGGMRQARGWRDFAWHGLLVTVWSNWWKPISLSPATKVLMVSVAAAFGAIVRMLWVVYV